MSTYQIGDVVLVKAVRAKMYKREDLSKFYNTKTRVFEEIPLKEPRWAQITGIKVCLLGKRVSHGDDGIEFVNEGNKNFLGIRFGLRNKEEMILPEDIIEYQRAAVTRPVPETFQQAYRWTEQDREVLREEAKTAKRDKKGRFV